MGVDWNSSRDEKGNLITRRIEATMPTLKTLVEEYITMVRKRLVGAKEETI